MEWDLVCMVMPGLQERGKWIFSVISDISQSEARPVLCGQWEGGTESEILIWYLVWFPINSHKSHWGHSIKKKVRNCVIPSKMSSHPEQSGKITDRKKVFWAKNSWKVIHVPYANFSTFWNHWHRPSEELSSHHLILQETAAALTGVTSAHASHFPSLLSAPPSPGRRPRPLPAHMASSAPWAGGGGSPFSRRTHKCDYPDCDKVGTILYLIIRC